MGQKSWPVGWQPTGWEVWSKPCNVPTYSVTGVGGMAWLFNTGPGKTMVKILKEPQV